MVYTGFSVVMLGRSVIRTFLVLDFVILYLECLNLMLTACGDTDTLAFSVVGRFIKKSPDVDRMRI